MLQDTKSIVEDLGFVEGSNANPGDYVVEKAFVD
jgi:ferredoxin--NADP+ reductase